MPTTAWVSFLALAYVLTMAGYHGVFLITRFVLPDPEARAQRGVKSVLVELFLTLVILGPLLRRIVPVLTWVRGPSALSAALFYVATFAWLPLLKASALVARGRAQGRDRVLGLLYSVPVSVLYLLGIGYLLCVTVSMMLLG